jgi:hypothetical protein
MRHFGPRITAQNKASLTVISGEIKHVQKHLERGTGATLMIGDTRQAVYCPADLWETLRDSVAVGKAIVVHAASLAAAGLPKLMRLHAADI